MELIGLLLLLGIGGVMLLGLVFLISLAAGSTSKAKEKESNRKREMFDERFNGAPEVVIESGGVGPRTADVIHAAGERGYELQHTISERYGATLTFRKRPQ